MAIRSLLVANRGEIAVRIIRAAQELGIRTVAIYSTDDARELARADSQTTTVPLSDGSGARRLPQCRHEIARLARATGCDAVHPGYGFLAENAEFSC